MLLIDENTGEPFIEPEFSKYAIVFVCPVLTLTLPTKRYGELLVIIAQIDNDIVICSLCKDGAPIFVIDDIEEFLNIYKSHYI